MAGKIFALLVLCVFSISCAPVNVTASSDSPRPHLFGTVEFQRPIDTLPGWLDVLDRNQENPVFYSGSWLGKENWDTVYRKASGLSKLERLKYINSFWNLWPYIEDARNWGQQDYWEAPFQFIKKSGDCEDYAIAKYFSLKKLGFTPADMRIVVLRDTVRNLPHAVLAVYLNGDIYILDNLSNIVLSHKRLKNYRPQYSVNELGRWAHIRPKKS